MSQIGEASFGTTYVYPRQNSASQAMSRLGVVLNAPELNLLSAVRTAGTVRSHLAARVSHCRRCKNAMCRANHSSH
jgi:hypothetical protein